MGKLLMKKNELKLEKSTATMLYPTLLTKINNGDIIENVKDIML